MARLRKEKGRSAKDSRPAVSTSDVKSTAKSSHKSGKNGLSKEQVVSLGGDEADLELLKGVNEDVGMGSGSASHDATLQNDVLNFLNELTIGSGKGKDGAKSKTKGKDKETQQQQQASNSKQKQVKKEKADPVTAEKPSKKDKKLAQKTETPAPASAAPAAQEDRPKVVLPTKITLNPKSHFIFPPTSQWYTALPPLTSPSAASASAPSIPPAQLTTLAQKASELHERDLSAFASSSSAGASEASFLAKIIASGTLSDRLSALTLLVQSSPLHNVKALETLRGMAERGKGKGGREESLKALRCIVDWWVGGGAPGRKLKYFRDQPLLHPGVTDEYLLLWHFEDWLKKYFFSVLQILETLSLDPLPYVRTQTISLIFTLLKDKPEQEQNLLRLLVNKLGDTEKSLASRASYHLLQLLQSHPAMKSIVVREIISLVLRPAAPSTAAVVAAASASASAAANSASANKHIRFSDTEPAAKPTPAGGGKDKLKEKEKKNTNSHAQYYATVTFNQIVLTPGDREVALQLIDVYFEMFKELLGEGAVDAGEGEDDEVADGAKGKGKGKEGEEEIRTDKRGRVVDRGQGKGKGKGRVVEVKGAAGFTEVEDANSKLVSAILTGVNRALPFAKIDAADVGINKHIDTLFLITHKSTFNISLQALVLIQQISASLSSSLPSSASSSSTPSSANATAKSITDRYYRTLYASLHDTRLATSSKQAMYLNLFFKSVKADAGVGSDAAGVKGEKGERVKALVRRFVQVLVSGGGGAPEFIAGGLFLLGELFSSVPGLRAMINEKPKAAKGDDATTYDPRKREPQFAHASALPLWELTPLLNHYHPAVALHARQLLSSQPLTASADLSQNTLSHFLDRFVYKNPKKLGAKATDTEEVVSGAKGASAMQPAASALEGVKLVKGEAVRVGEVVNEGAFLRRRREDVPVDQLFFHEFFTRKSEREKAKAAKISKPKEGEDESGEDDDEEDVDEGDGDDDEDGDEKADEAASEFSEEDSDADEAEIWKVMQASMPKAAGEDDDLMEDSDDLDEDEDDDDVPLDFDDDSELNGDSGDGSEEEEEDGSEGGLSLVEDSDNEDLIPLDGMEHPLGLIEYDGSDADSDSDSANANTNAIDEEEVWGGITSAQSGDKKRKRGDGEKEKEGRKEQRKKRRALPTFASYEDYAKMIEDGPEDDI